MSRYQLCWWLLSTAACLVLPVVTGWLHNCPQIIRWISTSYQHHINWPDHFCLIHCLIVSAYKTNNNWSHSRLIISKQVGPQLARGLGITFILSDGFLTNESRNYMINVGIRKIRADLSCQIRMQKNILLKLLIKAEHKIKLSRKFYLNKVKDFMRRNIKYVNGDSFPAALLSATSSDTSRGCPLFSPIWKYFLLFMKYFVEISNCWVGQMSLLSSKQQWELQWKKKSPSQYLIEYHFTDAVTKSHTTKILGGSYCTKMSVICVKSLSFVWHEGIIILYRMCIWYLRGWTRGAY